MQVILNAQTYKAALEQQCEQWQVARQGDKDALQHTLVLPRFLVKHPVTPHGHKAYSCQPCHTVHSYWSSVSVSVSEPVGPRHGSANENLFQDLLLLMNHKVSAPGCLLVAS